MIQFPEINENDIQQWVGDTAYQRGYRYFEDEAILNPRRRAFSLISECQGSQPTPYRVEIRLGAEGLLDGSCTCPAGAGGHCKHAAALLLTWIDEPDLFNEVPELEQVLEERSKEDLISLIREMVTRYPGLELLLELSALSNLPAGEILPPDLITQQIRRAFSSAGGAKGDNSLIAENLQAILDLGEELLDREEVRNAITVYETLMEGLLAYEDCLYHDQGGDLGQVLAECEQGIQDCLENTQDAELRQGLLHTLFDLFVWDLQAGNLGFADETPAILSRQADPEEKRIISTWIQQEMPEGEEWGNHYQRAALGGLWLLLMGSALDDEDFLRICRETWRTQDLVNRLLDLGRVDEALAAARSAGRHQYITAVADLFEKYGHPLLGMQIIKEQVDSATDIQLLQWLKQYALRHNMPQDALQLADSLFWIAQSLDNYNDLLKAAAVLDEQPAVRTRVINRLENAGNFSLLVEIYLLENEIDLALSTLELVKPEIWGERLSVLRHQVAQAVEATRPREAIRQYLLLVEAMIEQGSRGSYAKAAILLQRVQRLYHSLGEDERATLIIQGLRSEYQHLPALLDELRRAEL